MNVCNKTAMHKTRGGGAPPQGGFQWNNSSSKSSAATSFDQNVYDRVMTIHDNGNHRNSSDLPPQLLRDRVSAAADESHMDQATDLQVASAGARSVNNYYDETCFFR